MEYVRADSSIATKQAIGQPSRASNNHNAYVEWRALNAQSRRSSCFFSSAVHDAFVEVRVRSRITVLTETAGTSRRNVRECECQKRISSAQRCLSPPHRQPTGACPSPSFSLGTKMLVTPYGARQWSAEALTYREAARRPSTRPLHKATKTLPAVRRFNQRCPWCTAAIASRSESAVSPAYTTPLAPRRIGSSSRSPSAPARIRTLVLRCSTNLRKARSFFRATSAATSATSGGVTAVNFSATSRSRASPTNSTER